MDNQHKTFFIYISGKKQNETCLHKDHQQKRRLVNDALSIKDFKFLVG